MITEEIKIKTNDTCIMRVSKNFKDLIKQLIEHEKKRKFFHVLKLQQQKYLYQRIKQKGGLKVQLKFVLCYVLLHFVTFLLQMYINKIHLICYKEVNKHEIKKRSTR